jgi:hypothetical protein
MPRSTEGLTPRYLISPSHSPLFLQKCDEQREGDSCKTCKRLTIKCLGWGPKRPDWMRVCVRNCLRKVTELILAQDKKAVDDYKANIKAQLSRAGLIRGQPRMNGVHPSPPPRRQPNSTARRPTASSNASRLERSPSFTPTHHQVEVSFVSQSNYSNQHLIPTVPGE